MKVFQKDSGKTLTTSLISYYKLENRTDFLNKNDLTETGGPVYSAGKVNNAVDFGTTETKRLDIGSNMQITGGAISYGGWVNPNAQPAAKDFVLASQSDNTNNIIYFIDRNTDAGQFQVARRKNGVGTDQITYTVALTNGVWYHIVHTYDGTNQNFYFNGSLVAGPTAASGNGTVAPGNTFSIGAYPGGTNMTEFKEDEWGIWSRILTSTEITDLYNGASGQTMIDIGGGNLPLMGVG